MSNDSEYTIKQKRILSSGEIKIYNYKQKYIKRGTKFSNFINKYNDIILNKDLKPVEKLNKLYTIMTAEEKKQYTLTQIRNLIYRH